MMPHSSGGSARAEMSLDEDPCQNVRIWQGGWVQHTSMERWISPAGVGHSIETCRVYLPSIHLRLDGRREVLPLSIHTVAVSNISCCLSCIPASNLEDEHICSLERATRSPSAVPSPKLIC
jgi:hypothetical protein